MTVAEDPAPVQQKGGGDDCDAKGINTAEGKTGTCAIDGVTYRVVDRRGSVKLQNTTTSLKSVYVVEQVEMPEGYGGENVRPENGRFVLLRIGVRNNSNEPLEKRPARISSGADDRRERARALGDGAAAFVPVDEPGHASVKHDPTEDRQ